MIGNKHLEYQGSKNKHCRHDMTIETGNKLSNLSHGSNISSDIERVGNQKEQYNTLKHNWWKGGFDVGRKPFSGNPSYTCAHGLNSSHQRKCERHCPEHIETELSSSLRVCRYAAWIIISNSCYKPRPDPGERVLLQATPEKLNHFHR